MAWTFAHPAFVLPLYRLGSHRLNLPALAIGSMAPDLAFYLGLPGLGSRAHGLAGSVLLALPWGLALLALCVLLRRPLVHLLPQPHRAALGERFGGPVDLGWAALGLAVASTLIGVWSHLLVDLFTHTPGPGRAWLAWLDTQLAAPGGRVLLLHTFLQVVVSAIGVGVLVIAYRRWLGRWISRRGGRPVGDGQPAGWTWGRHLALLVAAGLIGLVYALSTAGPLPSMRAVEHQIFRSLVAATIIYWPLLIAAALALYRRRRR